MKFISVYSTKGGSGKSITTMNLIIELATVHKLKCMVIESDHQLTISDFRQLDKMNPQFKGMEDPYTIVRILPDAIPDYISKDPQKFSGYDICFIELPGILNHDIIQALRVCDGILMPLIPDKSDKASLMRSIKLIEKNVYNHRVALQQGFTVMAVMIKYNRRKLLHKAFKMFLESVGLDVFETTIRSLDAYANSTNTMLSLTDPYFAEGFEKTACEITEFANEFIEKFEVATVKA